MSRFYKTSRGTPIDWAYDMPFQEMYQGLAAKQMQQDSEVATTKEWKAQGQKLQSLTADNDQAEGIMKWIDDSADKFSNMDLTDRVNRNEVRDFSREVSKTFSQYGAAGNIQANHDARAARYKELKEVHKDNPMMVEKAMRDFDAQYEGVGGQERYGADYKGYGSRGIAKYQNLAKQSRTAILEAEDDIRHDKWTAAMQPYFVNKDEYHKMKKPERMARVMDSVLSEGANQDYIQDAVAFGYESGLTAESYNAPMYIQEPAVDENGKPILNKETGEQEMTTQLNPKSYKAKLFSEAYASTGREDRVFSENKNNSLYNQQAALRAKKAMLDELFTPLLNESTDFASKREEIGLTNFNSIVHNANGTITYKRVNKVYKGMDEDGNPTYDINHVPHTVGGTTGLEGNIYMLDEGMQSIGIKYLNDMGYTGDKTSGKAFNLALEGITIYNNYLKSNGLHANKKVDLPEELRPQVTKAMFGDGSLGGYFNDKKFVMYKEMGDGSLVKWNGDTEEILDATSVSDQSDYSPVVYAYNTEGSASDEFIGGMKVKISSKAGGHKFVLVSQATDQMQQDLKPTAQFNNIVQTGLGIIGDGNSGLRVETFVNKDKKVETRIFEYTKIDGVIEETPSKMTIGELQSEIKRYQISVLSKDVKNTAIRGSKSNILQFINN